MSLFNSDDLSGPLTLSSTSPKTSLTTREGDHSSVSEEKAISGESRKVQYSLNESSVDILDLDAIQGKH